MCLLMRKRRGRRRDFEGSREARRGMGVSRLEYIFRYRHIMSKDLYLVTPFSAYVLFLVTEPEA